MARRSTRGSGGTPGGALPAALLVSCTVVIAVLVALALLSWLGRAA